MPPVFDWWFLTNSSKMDLDKTHKDWSRDNLSRILSWIIVSLLIINLILTLLDLFFSNENNVILFESIIRIAILVTILYLIFKKRIWSFYGVAFLSLNAMKNSIRGLSAENYWSILDLIIQIFMIVASLTIIARNKINRNKVIATLRNLNKREVIFWGPASFITLGLACALILYTSFFLPFGLIEGKEKTIFDLFKIHFSIFPILTLITIGFSCIAIYKKSYLKTYISATFLAVFMLITTDTYQKVVGKPYLSAVDLSAPAFIGLFMIFLVGLYVLWGAFMNKDYFKLSKY